MSTSFTLSVQLGRACGTRLSMKLWHEKWHVHMCVCEFINITIHTPYIAAANPADQPLLQVPLHLPYQLSSWSKVAWEILVFLVWVCELWWLPCKWDINIHVIPPDQDSSFRKAQETLRYVDKDILADSIVGCVLQLGEKGEVKHIPCRRCNGLAWNHCQA